MFQVKTQASIDETFSPKNMRGKHRTAGKKANSHTNHSMPYQVAGVVGTSQMLHSLYVAIVRRRNTLATLFTECLVGDQVLIITRFETFDTAASRASKNARYKSVVSAGLSTPTTLFAWIKSISVVIVLPYSSGLVPLYGGSWQRCELSGC